jgi:hypothetical protein
VGTGVNEQDGTRRFEPHRVATLATPGQVLVLFCVVANLLVGWQLYAPLLDNGWGDFDDHTWRRDAERRATFATIFDPLLTTGHEAMDTSYVPVQSVIYHLSINVWQQGPWPIRVMGIWIHLVNSLLVLLLAYRFCGSIPGAHVASLAFLIWPRNAGTTAWLCASLAHGLTLMLYLAAFLLMQTWLHRRANGTDGRLGWWRSALAVLLFLAAVLTKELGATLAAALVLYDLIVVRGLRSLWPPRPRTLLGWVGRHGPFFLVVAGAVVVQSLKYESGFVHNKFGGVAFGVRNPIRLLELATNFLHWGPRWTFEEVYGAMHLLFVAFAAGLWAARRRPAALFLLLWIPLVLTPFTISNFRDVQSLGRYLYEASAVVAVLFALVGVAVVKWRPILTWPVLCGAAVALTIFAIQAQRAVG